MEEEKNQLIEKCSYDPLWDTEMLNLLQEAQTVLTNPVAIWDIADHNMKKLLINLLFKGKLYYDKKSQCYTFEVSLIYQLFKQQKNINPKVYAFGGHHVEIVKLLYEELSTKAEFLKAISFMIQRWSHKIVYGDNLSVTEKTLTFS